MVGTFLGVSALIATSPMRVHLSPAFPTASYVPPAGFRTLSTVSSAHRLAALFHAAATSRVHTFRGLTPLPTAVPCSHGQDLRVVVLASPCERRTARARMTGRDLEALLRPEVRLPEPGVTPAPGCAPLMVFVLFRVLPLAAV